MLLEGDREWKTEIEIERDVNWGERLKQNTNIGKSS